MSRVRAMFSNSLSGIHAYPPFSKITMVTKQWPSMQAFLAQQRYRESSNSSSKDDPNRTKTSSMTEDDEKVFSTARSHFDASRQDNLTIHQCIALELKGVDTILSSYCKPKDGHYIVKGLKLPRPLVTRHGETVPKSHLRLSHIMSMGNRTPKVVHFYAHPYGKLEMVDLALYLQSVVGELLKEGGGRRIFGMTSLGSQMSFFQS